MKFGSGTPWPKEPPAIVQQAEQQERSLKQIEADITKSLINCRNEETTIGNRLTECHKRELWRAAGYKSFTGWVLDKWGKSKSWAYSKMCEFAKELEDSVQKTGQNISKPQQNATSQNTTPPREDPPEKPAVQAATLEQMKPKEAPKHSENGKPKHLLAIWRELEESHFGRALNRIDELNRQCPNPKFHVELIAADKRCLVILEQWKQHITHA